MPVSEETYYFYLWRHRYVDDATDNIVTRTCFGITGNPRQRLKGYEGHVGHSIKFSHVWIGPKPVIRELELRVKQRFRQNQFANYEWICENASYDEIYDYVKNDVRDTFCTIEPIVIEDL